MFGVSRQTLERLRKEYPVGTRVELIRLDDPYRKIDPDNNVCPYLPAIRFA